MTKINLEDTNEAKTIQEKVKNGALFDDITETSEYSWIEFWLGEQRALEWLETLFK